METGTNTVVAVFENLESAGAAGRALANAGIPQGSFNIQSADSSSMAAGGEKTGGGFSAWLHDLFGEEPHEDQHHFAEAARRGHALLSVEASSEQQAEKVASILEQNGAVDIDRHLDSWRASGYQAETNSSAPLPVIEEEMQVGKRTVTTGGVRVFSRVVDQPVEENITLREEHVRVERRPVDREVTAEDLGRLRDQTIEVNETAEEAVISKRARVVEEVTVGKDASERTETVRDTVRRTEVEVDDMAGKERVTANR